MMPRGTTLLAVDYALFGLLSKTGKIWMGLLAALALLGLVRCMGCSPKRCTKRTWATPHRGKLRRGWTRRRINFGKIWKTTTAQRAARRPKIGSSHGFELSE